MVARRIAIGCRRSLDWGLVIGLWSRKNEEAPCQISATWATYSSFIKFKRWNCYPYVALVLKFSCVASWQVSLITGTAQITSILNIVPKTRSKIIANSLIFPIRHAMRNAIVIAIDQRCRRVWRFEMWSKNNHSLIVVKVIHSFYFLR